jgi:hypothetical protein
MVAQNSKTSQTELSNLQRVACLGITGAMRTAPAAAIEVLLELPPLHLQAEAEAKVGNCRLRCNDQWKPKSKGFGHAYMPQDMKMDPSHIWGLIKWYRDMFMITHSQSDSLIEVNGKRGFNLTERGLI